MQPTPTPWPTTCTDHHGVEATIANDGHTLTLRSVTFDGADLDDLQPAPGADPTALTTFTLSDGALCDCRLQTAIPVRLKVNGEPTVAALDVDLCLVPPRPGPRGGIEEELLTLSLTAGDVTLTSRGASGWFEDELNDIGHRRPPHLLHLRPVRLPPGRPRALWRPGVLP